MQIKSTLNIFWFDSKLFKLAVAFQYFSLSQVTAPTRNYSIAHGKNALNFCRKFRHFGAKVSPSNFSSIMKRPNKLSLDRQKGAAVVYRAFTLKNFTRVRKNSNEFRFDLKSLKKDFLCSDPMCTFHLSAMHKHRQSAFFCIFVAMRLWWCGRHSAIWRPWQWECVLLLFLFPPFPLLLFSWQNHTTAADFSLRKIPALHA